MSGYFQKPRAELITGRHDSLLAHINMVTPNQEVTEGDAIHVQCVVSYKTPDVLRLLKVEWERLALAKPDTVEKLAVNGQVTKVAADSNRIRAFVTKWKDGKHVQEHNLIVRDVNLNEDPGLYNCLVTHDGTVLASRHSVVSVVSKDARQSDYYYEEDYTSHHYYEGSPLLEIVNSTDDRVDRNANSEPPVLGPVTKQFIIVKRGMDVVLDCHNATSAEEEVVLWKKHGDSGTVGRGKKLRLMRVDTWDSGLYYCTTNTSVNTVTLKVDTLAPKVSTPGLDEHRIAYHSPGEQAILSCKAEAVPVPKISWYREVAEEDPESSSRSPNSFANEDQGPRSHRKMILLHSGDEFGINIDTYKDGVIQTSLHIREVENKHYGSYVCVAKNAQGEAAINIKLHHPSTRPHSSSSGKNLSSTSTLVTAIVMTLLLIKVFGRL